MALATKSSIAQATGLEEAYLDGVEARAAQAERHVRGVLGDARYDEIASLGSGADYDALVEAESLLALYYALPLKNLYLTEKGGIVTATGVEESRTELMRAFELDRYRSELRRQAEAILARLQTEPDLTFWIDVV